MAVFASDVDRLVLIIFGAVFVIAGAAFALTGRRIFRERAAADRADPHRAVSPTR